jgi:hypothetical protein
MADTLKASSQNHGQREFDDENEPVPHGAEYSLEASISAATWSCRPLASAYEKKTPFRSWPMPPETVVWPCGWEV